MTASLTSSGSTLLHRLRMETGPHHRGIEAEINALDPAFTLGDYHSLLRRFLGFYSPWETAVVASAPLLLAGRAKSASLLDDLQYLGTPPGETVPLCAALPPLDSLPRILGSMYVFEGATLGGQLLRRHFVARFGFNGRGCTFFTGYGDRTGAMWNQFRDTLEALPEEDSTTVIDSANATFAALRAWLSKAATIAAKSAAKSAA